MDHLKGLSARMKSDWDRRVSHDPFIWMSDAVDEATLWSTGERDFKILTSDIFPAENLVALEIGCGVGRLMRPASSFFKKVIGVDVSPVAIERAKENLKDLSKVELISTDGLSLETIASASIDVVYSFASLAIVPVAVLVKYLFEIRRVLKPTGIGILQLYVGSPQQVHPEDTLHLRCFDEENLKAGFSASGLTIIDQKPLSLPFETSSETLGFKASIVRVVPHDKPQLDAEEVVHLLLPEGERSDSSPHDLESWMSLSHAERFANEGKFDRARGLLEQALSVMKSSTIDVRDALAAIEAKLNAAASPQIQENNLRIEETSDGPIIYYEGYCLDHPSKPVAAAHAWAQRALADELISKAENLVVIGFGAGYHIEALLNITNKNIIVVEPIPEVFATAKKVRSLDTLLKRIKVVVGGEIAFDELDGSTELCVRPQSQAIAPDLCVTIRKKLYGLRGFASLHPSIAVLGPLQGGTLPITGYVARSLLGLQQRVRMIDTSGFAGSYHIISDFSKDKFRTVTLQNSYLEFISQVILENYNEKPFDILICMAQAPVSYKVLTELRKRGVITVLWFTEDYLRFTYWKQGAQFFDFVFTIQKGECINEIKKAGASEVFYLPVGADPLVHAPLALTHEERERWGSPISFVGAGYHNRQQVFASLAHLPLKLWGTEWPTCRPFDKLVQEEGRRLTPDEYTKIFNATDVNINLHSSTERDGVDPFGDFVNPRTFELASAGAFQLVDERSLLSELFETGSEIITFSNTNDLKEKINFYLHHPEERRKAIEKSRTRVLKDHTYNHRLKEMLSLIFQSRYEELAKKEESRPWSKLLKRASSDEELSKRCEVAFHRGEEPTLDALVSDIVTGNGKLTETEQKLLFLFHVRKQIILMKAENGEVKPS